MCLRVITLKFKVLLDVVVEEAPALFCPLSEPSLVLIFSDNIAFRTLPILPIEFLHK